MTLRAWLDVIVAFAVSGVAAGAGRWATRGVFVHPVFERTNYRGHPLPTSVGLLIAVTTAVVVGTYTLVIDAVNLVTTRFVAGVPALTVDGRRVVGLCVGLALFGLVDDLAGAGEHGGFRGHLGALASGRLTTGALKLIGMPLFVAAVVGPQLGATGRLGVVRVAVLVSLGANLGNLFDRAPGRTVKVGLVGFAALVAATRRPELVVAAVPMGAAAGLLGGDLAEDFMLGDAGSNVVGGALGFGVAVTTGAAAQWSVVVALLVLNVVSEAVSFSKVIDAVPPLRWFDRLGRIAR